VTQTKGTEQEVAWRAFHKAERAGKIVRPSACSRCDKTGKIEAHHHNGYAREHRLDVVFLCEPCHKAEHGKHMEA
jgi:hypothetical protein